MVYPHEKVAPIQVPKVMGTHVNMARCDYNTFATRH
jgi:hypothetical protein